MNEEFYARVLIDFLTDKWAYFDSFCERLCPESRLSSVIEAWLKKKL
jgi:hypothetical protein